MVIPELRAAGAGGRSRSPCFGDGTQSRSFTYVGDVVRAMVALIDEPRAVGQVFNIGNGEEITHPRPRGPDQGDDRQRVPDRRPFRTTRRTRPGFEDMPRRVPDIAKIRALVGYEPTVELDEILARVIEYFRQS